MEKAYKAFMIGLKISRVVHVSRHVRKVSNVLTSLDQENPKSDKQIAERGRKRQHVERFRPLEADTNARNYRWLL